jgi:hypothetical protein
MNLDQPSSPIPNSSYYDGFNKGSKNSKNKTEDNSYNDFNNNDRSFSNRTPLIEHYQNYSIPR